MAVLWDIIMNVYVLHQNVDRQVFDEIFGPSRLLRDNALTKKDSRAMPPMYVCMCVCIIFYALFMTDEDG